MDNNKLIIRKTYNQDEERLNKVIIEHIEFFLRFESPYISGEKRPPMVLISELLSLMSSRQKYEFYKKHIYKRKI